MDALTEKYARLATDNAPGQEGRQDGVSAGLLIGATLPGTPVDFSHGDVDAFPPPPAAAEDFVEGLARGAAQAYTEYRGAINIRETVAGRLAAFTGAPVSAGNELIITPGTQGALFLAVAATVGRGTKVAIVQPDYFANRKLVDFFEGTVVPVQLHYLGDKPGAGLDLQQLEEAFRDGVKVFIFSNPNNPAGVVFDHREIQSISDLAHRHGVTLIVDQLYSRLRYDAVSYTHLRALREESANVITIMGPSKTESLSGYRLGVAFGDANIIERMEKLQAIVSLRAGGYSQAVLRGWFSEPQGWMQERIRLHQAIRDDLLQVLRRSEGVAARTPEAGSYLFPRLPKLRVSIQDFVRVLRAQAGVTVTPGAEFGPHSLDSVRLNFSQDHAGAVDAARRMVQLIDRYRA